MCNLYDTIEKLCHKKGVSITQMCAESDVARASLTDLKKGRKKYLSAKTLGKISSYFSVSIDYLLGFEDDNGLTAEAWKEMGYRLVFQEEVFHVSLDEISRKSGVSRQTIDAFISGEKISVNDMDAIAYALGDEPSEFYGNYYAKIQKNKPAQAVEQSLSEFEYAAHQYDGDLTEEDKATLIGLMKKFAAANRAGGENGATD